MASTLDDLPTLSLPVHYRLIPCAKRYTQIAISLTTSVGFIVSVDRFAVFQIDLTRLIYLRAQRNLIYFAC